MYLFVGSFLGSLWCRSGVLSEVLLGVHLVSLWGSFWVPLGSACGHLVGVNHLRHPASPKCHVSQHFRHTASLKCCVLQHFGPIERAQGAGGCILAKNYAPPRGNQYRMVHQLGINIGPVTNQPNISKYVKYATIVCVIYLEWAISANSVKLV